MAVDLTQAIIALTTISTVFFSIIMPFTYFFGKELETNLYEEYDKISKILENIKIKEEQKKRKSSGKSQTNSNSENKLMKKFKGANKNISTFLKHFRQLMAILAIIYISSISLGLCLLLIGQEGIEKGVYAMLVIFFIEILLFLLYAIIIFQHTPIKWLRILRKERINLENSRIGSVLLSEEVQKKEEERILNKEQKIEQRIKKRGIKN